MRATTRNTLLVAILAAALGGCGEDEEAPPPPEVLLERATAFRRACAAKELAETATEDLAMLESAAANVDPGSPTAEMTRVTSLAAAEFARGYQRHAELRSATYALLDSAVNHSATPEDSLRYEERASAFSISAPREGTIEANAMSSFENNLNAILSDDDHPCNWNIPGLAE